MEFRNLKLQYQNLKEEIDQAVTTVMTNGNFISGSQVTQLEQQLCEYTGQKHCITCANGTDALKLALMAWGIHEGDAVFVPDLTFFSSGEVVSDVGATPVFVDVEMDTFNISVSDLEASIQAVLKEGKLVPRVIIAVDLFGLPADYAALRKLAKEYGLYLLEDGAQGFGGKIYLDGKWQMACSFGDISTTSFFPAKPLGCYGDGGAIFTNDDTWAALIRSYCVHGKGDSKYDNIRIGMNSRLDTIQAAILKVKLKAFQDVELSGINQVAAEYTSLLTTIVTTPVVPDGFYSSWAQYTILLQDEEQRNQVQQALKEQGIPSMVYYQKPMHLQKAFEDHYRCYSGCLVTADLSKRVLSLPIDPYKNTEEIRQVCKVLGDILK